MDKFTNYVELQAEKAETLSFCRGIKLLHIRDKVEAMLGFIGKSGIFEEYTVHNIAHIDEMLKIAEWLIPDTTKGKMTYAEWLMLTLAIYFHDLGMIVTKEEYEHRYDTDFKEYKENILETNYPAFTVPRGFKCRNNREINDTHTNLITSIYCSKPSSITSPVESKRTELRALR